jgi:hypothetical protein
MDAGSCSPQARRLSAKADEIAQAWAAGADPSHSLGHRHHLVPVMYLRAFARDDQLLVRRIPEHRPITCNISDLAQKDFYTVLADDPDGGPPRPDARIEQALQLVEGPAARVLGLLRNPLLARRRLTDDERDQLAQFLAFQLVRGARLRREIELLADYHAKITATANGYDGTLEDLASLRIVSHPNEHMRLLAGSAEQAHRYLRNRPVCVVELDRPLLFTCDEPVLVIDDGSGDQGHRPECFLTERERRRRRRKAFARGEDQTSELVHFVPTRPSGIAVTQEIALPLDPHRLLLLGPEGADSDPHVRVTGDDADEIAAQITAQVVDQAYLWVAGHPEHPGLRDFDMPEPGPVLRLCDGGSPLSNAFDNAPTPRQPTRFRANWT